MKKVLMIAQCCICFLLAAGFANGQNSSTPVAKVPDENALKPVVLKTTKPVETAKDADKYKPVAPVFNELTPLSDKQIKEDKNQQKTKPIAPKEPDSRTPVKKVEYKEPPQIQASVPVTQDAKKPIPEQQKQ